MLLANPSATVKLINDESRRIVRADERPTSETTRLRRIEIQWLLADDTRIETHSIAPITPQKMNRRIPLLRKSI